MNHSITEICKPSENTVKALSNIPTDELLKAAHLNILEAQKGPNMKPKYEIILLYLEASISMFDRS